jgi:hypothetical protein
VSEGERERARERGVEKERRSGEREKTQHTEITQSAPKKKEGAGKWETEPGPFFWCALFTIRMMLFTTMSPKKGNRAQEVCAILPSECR